MANTVNILGYANTFGDWIVATNADSNEINSIGKYDWTKDSGTLFLNGTGTGLSVSNNTIISGQLLVTGTSSSVTIDNNLTVDKQVYFTNTSQTLTASGLIYANGTVYAGNTGTGLAVSNNTIMGGTLLVSGAANVQNTLVVLKSADLQNTLTVGGDTTITGNIGISGSIYTNLLQSNTLIRSANASVSGGTYTNTLQANTSILTDTIQSNTSINTVTSYATKVQANTSVNTAILSVTGNSYASHVNANSSVTTPSLTVTNINANNNNTGTAYFNHLYANNVYAAGNFVISGSTVYNATTLTLSADTPVPSTAALAVYRGAGANAVIQWSNTTNYWSILDVNNPTALTQYSQIMTANMISDSTTSTSTATVPTSKSLTNAFLQANAAFNQANSAGTFAQPAFIQANAAFTQANVGASLVNSGGTINGALSIIGNLQVNGSASYINVATFQTVDSLIQLAANNTSDSVDIGFYGQYVSAGTKFTGLVRTASSNYALFQGITTNPTSNSIGTITSVNYATLNANIAAGQITSTQPIPVTSGGTGVTTSTGSGNNVLSNSPTLVTPALGTPSSGNLTNCTFPTLNQNTTGTSAGLTGTPNITVGTINSSDITASRTATPTTGYIYFGNSGTKYIGFDGTNIIASVSPSFSITGSSASCTGNAATATTAGNVTGTVAIANGGTGATAGYKLFAAEFTTSINANTDRTVGMYGSYGSSATNTPTTSGILYNFTSGTTGNSDGGQFWQDYVTNNLYLRQRWGGTYGSWLTILSSSNFNSYSSVNNLQFNSIGVGTAATGSAGEIVATGNITAAYSDDNLKTKLGNITNALEKVKSLNGFYYEANQTAQDLGYSVKREVGLSAQQVQEILPEVVVPAPISDKYLTIHYERIIPLLVEAIKELEEQVQDLKSKLP